MTDTFTTPTTPTQAEMDEYIRRSHQARNEAIAAMFRWIRSKLTGRPQVPAGAKYA